MQLAAVEQHHTRQSCVIKINFLLPVDNSNIASILLTLLINKMGILRERNVENLLKDIVFQYINIAISFIDYFAFLKRIKSSVGRVTVMCSRIKKSCRRRRILFTASRPPHYYTEKLSSFPFIEFRHFCLARCTFCRPTASSKKDAVVVIH